LTATYIKIPPQNELPIQEFRKKSLDPIYLGCINDFSFYSNSLPSLGNLPQRKGGVEEREISKPENSSIPFGAIRPCPGSLELDKCFCPTGKYPKVSFLKPLRMQLVRKEERFISHPQFGYEFGFPCRLRSS
jgi:hypothetical protein